MTAKIYGLINSSTFNFEHFCKKAKIHIIIDANDDGTSNITINSPENQCAIGTSFATDQITITSFSDFDYPHMSIDANDFERLVII